MPQQLPSQNSNLDASIIGLARLNHPLGEAIGSRRTGFPSCCFFYMLVETRRFTRSQTEARNIPGHQI